MRIAHAFSLRAPYFARVVARQKTVEGRLRKPDLLNLQVNDCIRFKEHPPGGFARHVDVKITFLRTFPTFREMLKKEGLENCLPGMADLEEGVAVYHHFPRYREREKELGVLAIGIECLKKEEA